MEQYTVFLNKAFLFFLLVHGIAGFFGGIGSILLAGEYIKSRWITDPEGKKVKLIYGSIKEPFVGILSGILIPLPLLDNASIPMLLALSLVAGFGSSKFLKSYIDSKTNEITQTSVYDSLSFEVIESPTPSSEDTKNTEPKQ